MSFLLGELRDWIEAGGVAVRLHLADGTEAGPATEGLRCLRAVTDSRAVDEGTLFCAVQGEHTHGAGFLEAAFEAGASAALVEGEAPRLAGCVRPVLEVANGRQALLLAARGWLDRHPAKVIGITGSNGKTTTKDFLGAALAGELSASVSPGNLNSLWGLPLAVLGFAGDEDWVVLEMGASAPDEIARLAAIARPRIGCVTNVAPAHLEAFGSVGEVLRAKAQLLEALPEDGVAVVNADDPTSDFLREHSAARNIVSFGYAEHADIRVESVYATEDGVQARIDGVDAVLPAFGEVNASNAAAAVAIARQCGVPTDRALERISRARLSPHRSNRCAYGGRAIIDDCYNANPVSVRQALDGLAKFPGARARIAVLGDMAELGAEAVILHREVLQHALQRGLELVLVAGPLYAAAAPQEAPEGLVVFDRIDVEALCETLEEHSHEGDVILLKGSRSAGLERILDALCIRWSGGIPGQEQKS